MTLSVALYGDSISSGTHGGGAYHQALRDAGADPLHLHAVGGSSLATGSPGCLVEVLADPAARHHDLDVAFVWHGSNDWYWGTPLGAAGDTDPSTFRGAWRHCTGLLRESSPGVRIIAPTPLWRWEAPAGSDAAGDASATPNRRGHTLLDYARVIRELAAELRLEVVPMARLTGFGPDNADEFYEDRVHPNALGYRRIAPALVGAMTGGRAR